MSAAYAVATGLHLFSVGLVVGFMAITLWALIPAQTCSTERATRRWRRA